MGWKATGEPVVRQQRGKWTVRVDGIDTETGHQRPRQLGMSEEAGSVKGVSSERRRLAVPVDGCGCRGAGALR